LFPRGRRQGPVLHAPRQQLHGQAGRHRKSHGRHRAARAVLAEDQPSALGMGLNAPMDTAHQTLRVLILEDEPADAELIERALQHAGLTFEAKRVDAWAPFEAALEEFRPDILIADYKLPGFTGRDALDHARRQHPEIPVVIVTGALGDEEAVELVKAGARDYVLKDNLWRLPPAVEQAIAVEQGM